MIFASFVAIFLPWLLYPVSLEWAVAIVTFEILCVLGVLEVSL